MAAAYYCSVIAAVLSCAGSAPAGSKCKETSDCESGLQCLFPLGSGCAASGQCLVASADCSGTAEGLILCGCAGSQIDLACVPSSAALPQRTATGAACIADGGPEAGTDARADQ